MCACPSNSPGLIPWQARSIDIVRNLRGALLSIENTKEKCHEQTPKKLTTQAICMIFVFLGYVILTVISSSMDAYGYFQKDSTKKKLSGDSQKKTSGNEVHCSGNEKKLSKTKVWMHNVKTYISFFSVQKNVKSLLSTASDEYYLDCLDGIRFIGVCVVIHSHITGFYANVLRNEEKNLATILNWNTLPKGVLAIDAFFILSGILNGYSVSREYHEKKGRISWLSLPVRRFWKLTPLLMIAIGGYTTLFPYMGSGTLWPKYDTNPVCKENWIWNLLYLNNFIPHDKQCIISTWYMACLMQLHTISPLFLILLLRKPKMGYALTVFASVLSCLGSFVLIMHYDFVDTLMLSYKEMPDMLEILKHVWSFFDIVYSKPYIRMGSYVIGLALGCYIHKQKLENFKKFSLAKLSFGWIIFIISMRLCCMGIIHSKSSDYEIVAFHSSKPLIYSCCLSWVIFLCVTDQGGILNKFLSCKLFKVLSRLSYGAYLFHVFILEKYYLSFEELIDHSMLTLVLTSTYLIVWVHVVSLFFTLFFGIPHLRIYNFFDEIYQKKFHQKMS